MKAYLVGAWRKVPLEFSIQCISVDTSRNDGGVLSVVGALPVVDDLEGLPRQLSQVVVGSGDDPGTRVVYK